MLRCCPIRTGSSSAQEGLPPVRAGRFFVYGAHDEGRVPHGVIPDAHRGGHGVRHRPSRDDGAVPCRAERSRQDAGAIANVLDLGCGTGLLAIGAAKLWQRRVIASAISTLSRSRLRARTRVANGVAPLVRAIVADGMVNPTLAAGAPYDLIVANILAGPLTHLAPQIARGVARGGDARPVRPSALAGESCAQLLSAAWPVLAGISAATGPGSRLCLRGPRGALTSGHGQNPPSKA